MEQLANSSRERGGVVALGVRRSPCLRQQHPVRKDDADDEVFRTSAAQKPQCERRRNEGDKLSDRVA